MTLQDLVSSLHFDVLSGADKLEREVSGGYVADLLSCVMAGAESGNVWVTLQTHSNIIAVAALAELSGIIVAEGAAVPPDTLAKATEQGMVVLSSPLPVYQTVAQLVSLGV